MNKKHFIIPFSNATVCFVLYSGVNTDFAEFLENHV